MSAGPQPKRVSSFQPDTGRAAFVPAQFAFPERRALFEHVARYPMAQLFTAAGARMAVSSLPLICTATSPWEADTKDVIFVGHLAKRNSQCEAIAAGAPALALFFGPSAYISPRWFKERKTVPTWNYVSVQIRGRLEPVEDADSHRETLRQTIRHMEATLTGPSPWRLEDADPQLVETLSTSITAFRLMCEDIEGIARLNQDKTPVDRDSIIHGLAQTGEPAAAEVAELMKRWPPRRG